jgi:hypothetical protein
MREASLCVIELLLGMAAVVLMSAVNVPARCVDKGRIRFSALLSKFRLQMLLKIESDLRPC